MRRELAKDVFAFVALFSLLDGDGMRDLLGWWGFSILSGGFVVVSVITFLRNRARLRTLLWRSTAAPLAAFVAICLLSTLWSNYPATTLLGSLVQIATATIGIALVLLRPIGRLLTIFATVVQANLALSLLFELIVPLLPGGRLMPFFTNYPPGSPGAYYWSLGLIWTGDRIQGIVGNANLTCFLALIGGITILSLLVARRIPKRLAFPALALDALMFELSRSATVIVAGVIVLAVTAIVLGYRRVRGRSKIVLSIGAVVVLTIASISSSNIAQPVLRLLGKADDLTGRLEIWHVVSGLVSQRPVLGWGWVGYWPPWAEPYRNLIVRDRVQYLQAHNAYLDVELQVGVVGLIAFVIVIAALVFRAVRLAAVRAPLTLLPLLLTAALLTQALAESRLLIEGNWAMLTILSVTLPWGRHHRLSPKDGLRAEALAQ